MERFVRHRHIAGCEVAYEIGDTLFLLKFTANTGDECADCPALERGLVG